MNRERRNLRKATQAEPLPVQIDERDGFVELAVEGGHNGPSRCVMSVPTAKAVMLELLQAIARAQVRHDRSEAG
jgi:hypothetical protein